MAEPGEEKEKTHAELTENQEQGQRQADPGDQPPQALVQRV